MRACSLLRLAAIAAVVCAAVASTAATETSSCPWRTVAHLDDPFIQNLGGWAVYQQQTTVLTFNKVERARAQAIGNCLSSMNRNYELIIDASIRAGAADGKYRAVVHVINYYRPESVLSFEAILRTPPAN